MGNKMSLGACAKPGSETCSTPVEYPVDGFKVKLENVEGGVAHKRSRDEQTPRPQAPLKSSSSEYHSDVHTDKPALVGGLVHAYHIDRFDQKYDLTDSKWLGQGTCGSVCTVKARATGDVFALKEIALTKIGGSMSSLRKEVELQKRLDHPNICKILESFEDRKRGRMYIIMELCTGGSLVSRMKDHRHGYGEQAAATLVEKMLSAILYCHHHGVVHRDIKLDNMIYEDEREDAELKLIDFGFARAVCPGRETMHDQLGTPSYMSPELWAERETPYDSSVDMWAIGVVAYMLLSGQRPFHHQDRKEKARMIREDVLRFPERYWSNVSQDAKDFCTALIQKAPGDRLSASEAVRHPWIATRSRQHTGDNGLDAAHELERHNEIVASLQSFGESEDLQKLALEVIAFSTPPSKVEDLRHLFQKMDEDDSGTLSLDEFKHAMVMHPEIPEDQVEQIFSKMDSNHSGEVDYTEFLAATVSSHKIVSRGSIRNAFGLLDVDGDGYITKGDLHGAFDGKMSESSCKRFVSGADEEGRISFETFRRVVTQGIPFLTPEGRKGRDSCGSPSRSASATEPTQEHEHESQPHAIRLSQAEADAVMKVVASSRRSDREADAAGKPHKDSSAKPKSRWSMSKQSAAITPASLSVEVTRRSGVRVEAR